MGSLTVVLSFVAFLLAFVVIGVLSVIKNRHTSADYLLASHNIKPWLTALSAIATNNSGYMFVGLIGFTYATGLSSMWLMIGWIFGDFLASLFVHKRLRAVTENRRVLSFGGALSNWNETDFKILRTLVGLFTIIFLGTYAAAQLNAGSKALHVLFGWDYSLGAIIGAVIVLLYCFAGGLRASIWTDAAQSFVMIVAMALMLIAAMAVSGGAGAFWGDLRAVEPGYMNIFPADLAYGALLGPMLFVAGWIFAGVGVIGQPHIMVRFMAMQSPDNINKVRLYYYSWYIAFAILCVGAGLAARLLLDVNQADFDAELALPLLALQLLPDVLVGLVLAGLFAATMSTADSQIIACTAALTRDFGHGKLESYWVTKAATVVITVIALIIALSGPESVFLLIVMAWAALGSAFGPLLIVYALRQRPSEVLAIAMMTGGTGAMLGWRYYGDTGQIYEIMPGILTGLAVFIIGKLFGQANAKPALHTTGDYAQASDQDR